MLSRDSGLKNVLSELEMRDIRNQLYKTIAKDNHSKPQEKKRYISPYQFRPANSPLISPVQTQFRSQRDSSTNSAISRGQEFSRTPAQNTIQVSFTISCSLRNLNFGHRECSDLPRDCLVLLYKPRWDSWAMTQTYKPKSIDQWVISANEEPAERAIWRT